jgi:cytoskeletal protein RodZ
MAQSFWSKRKDSVSKAGGYIKAADSVSRPTAILMTVLGILVVGGLMFGIFSATRWAYTQIAGKKDNTTITQGPSITETSSTSTTTPSTDNASSTTNTQATAPSTPVATTTPSTSTAPATSASTNSSLPKTGAGSNALLFVALVCVSYAVYRRRQINS